jgi:hypothetical protein
LVGNRLIAGYYSNLFTGIIWVCSKYSKNFEFSGHNFEFPENLGISLVYYLERFEFVYENFNEKAGGIDL